jgi:hypothetical protein
METYTLAYVVKIGAICFFVGALIAGIVVFFACKNNPKLVQEIGAKLEAEFNKKEKEIRDFKDAEIAQIKMELDRFKMKEIIKEILAELGIKKE